MNPMRGMIESATHGKLALQRCTACGTMQYPPRELCANCLADTLEWRVSDDAPGEVMANTVLHHSHEPAFGAMLPMRVGLVRLDGCDRGVFSNGRLRRRDARHRHGAARR
jgi:uncharacterized OB-fold protein